MDIHLRPDQEIAAQAFIRAGMVASEMDIFDIGLDKINKKMSIKLNSTKQGAIERIRNMRKNISVSEDIISKLLDEDARR